MQHWHSAVACTLALVSSYATLAFPAAPAAARPEAKLESLWTRKRGADWPGFLGPTADGKSAETGLVAPWPPAGPRIVWQRQVGDGYGIGSVSQGRYYHFDGWSEQNGTAGRARCTCVRAESGEELWRFEYSSSYGDMLGYDSGPRASPVIDGNRVYLLGAEGYLHCLKADDGQVLWQVDTNREFGVVRNFFGVGSTPIIAKELLICMVGGSPPGTRGLYESGGQVNGNGSGIVAFDKYSGKVVYAASDELASYATPKLATLAGRPWCFVFARGGLLAFEPATGRVDFHYPWRASLLESVNASTPVVEGNEVFVSEAYQLGSSLLAVRPGGYDIVWRDARNRREKAFKAHWNTPICVDGFLYGCSGRNSGDADLRCVEWKTGRLRWAAAQPPGQRSSLLYVDGHFIGLGERGTLQLIRANPDRYELVSEAILRNSDSGSGSAERDTSLLSYPCWAAPILAHGLLFVRGAGRVVCLEIIPDRP